MIVPDRDCVFEPVELLDVVADAVPERVVVGVGDGVNVEAADLETVDVVLNDAPAEGLGVALADGCTTPLIKIPEGQVKAVEGVP